MRAARSLRLLLAAAGLALALAGAVAPAVHDPGVAASRNTVASAPV